MLFQIICSDGWIRNHSGIFDNADDAVKWAEWGHICMKRHLRVEAHISFDSLDSAQLHYADFVRECRERLDMDKKDIWSFLAWMDNLGHSYPNRSFLPI